MGVFARSVTLCVLLACNWALDSPPPAVEVAFLAYNIVPDSVKKPPLGYITVEFPDQVQAILGNILTPAQVRLEPIVSWVGCPFIYYTLACVDLDAFSRQNPNISEIRHWLVGNIPGDEVQRGDVLSPYNFPRPDAGSGFHRYVFFVFKQHEKIDFKNLPDLNVTTADVTRFTINKFSREYNLEGPIYGNFYMSRFANEIC